MDNFKYVITADTDIGISRKVNQDSLLIKHAFYGDTEIVMAIICDGMGGLSEGEVASATVIYAFDQWFTNELPAMMEKLSINDISSCWRSKLEELNIKLQTYGKGLNKKLGTTFTGALFINNDVLVVHVGDTRLYYLNSSLHQITCDHTLVQREIAERKMTKEEASKDKRKNILLQCIGASKKIKPQIIYGKVKQGIYMLCSDGFRNKITDEEIFEMINPQKVTGKNEMREISRNTIEFVKSRAEKDNITVMLIKVNDKSSGDYKDFYTSLLKNFGEKLKVKFRTSNSKKRKLKICEEILVVNTEKKIPNNILKCGKNYEYID